MNFELVLISVLKFLLNPPFFIEIYSKMNSTYFFETFYRNTNDTEKVKSKTFLKGHRHPPLLPILTLKNRISSE